MPPPDHAASGEPAAAVLSGLIWETLIPIIGTGATATLLRRSARRASHHGVGVDGLVIEQRGFQHTYTLSDAWREPNGQADDALRALTKELRPLLIELTGPVLLTRLNANPDLERAKLFAGEDDN